MLLDRLDGSVAAKRPEPVEQVNQPERAPETNIAPAANDYNVGTMNYNASMMRFRLERERYIPPPEQPETFTDDTGVPEPSDPLFRTSGPGPDTFDSPEEYARYIKYGFAYGDESQAHHFVGALYEHKDDTEWTQRFLTAIGTREAARLISTAEQVVPDGNSSRVVAQALTNMVRDGRFNQADMNNLVRNMASNAPYSTFRDVAALFDNVSNTAEGTALKNMFGAAAIALTSGTGSFTNTNYSDEVKNTFAAIGTRTMASTGGQNEAIQLNEWRKLVGNAALSEFITRAMSADPIFPDEIDSARLSDLFNSVLNAGPHYAGSTLTESIIPLADLRELEAGVFNGAVQSFKDENVFNNYKENVEIKNALSKLFMADFETIMASRLAPNAARFDDSDFRVGMGRFFQLALFTHTADSTSTALSQFVITKLSALKNGLLDNSPDADQRFQQFFGLNREDGAALAGSMLGMMTEGIGHAKADLEADAKQKAEAISLIVDIGLSLIPKGGDALTSQLSEGIIRDLLQGSSNALQSQITGDLKNGLVDEAKKAFADALEGKDLVQIMAGIYYAFVGQLPNENRNLLGQFEGAYRAVVTDVPPDQS